MAHERQHFTVSNSSSQRIMTSLQFLGITSYTSTAWVDTFKTLSALQPCWSQWELKHTLLLSDQSLARGTPIPKVRVNTNREIGAPLWNVEVQAKHTLRHRVGAFSFMHSLPVLSSSRLSSVSSSAKHLRQIPKLRCVNTQTTLKWVVLLYYQDLFSPLSFHSQILHHLPETHRIILESPWELPQAENSDPSCKQFYK